MSNIELRIKEKYAAWNLVNDGYYRNIIFNSLLSDNMKQKNVEEIVKNANQILRKCPNPKIAENCSNTGIVIGKVQSGKTSNFITLIALAFDNGYNIAVVLGGNNLNLVDQNAERIKGYFSKAGDNLVVVSTKDSEDSIFNSDEIQRFISIGKKVIIVGLKHAKHIKKIKILFEKTPLSNIPTLIIDDEGDQATLNTRVKYNERSAIYAEALNLKKCINKHSFISVTATPQANILIDTIDKLSPDFGVLTQPGDGYCGLGTFHGEDEKKYIRILPQHEQDLFEGTSVPNSFKEALAVFFVGAAIRKYRGDEGKHAFLVHPSQKIVDHKAVQEKINKELLLWEEKAKLELTNSGDILYKNFKKLLLKGYEDIHKWNKNIPLFDEIEKDILDRIIKCSRVLLCNSTSNAADAAKNYPCNIFVGGNLVERGITIKGLAVTYITRRAKGISNVDNTEQRARWFGYKSSYLDLCRVYTTENIADDFRSIYDHDEDLWSTIERNLHRNLKFKDIPRVFRLSNVLLRLTRKTVATSERLKYSEWTKDDYFVFDKNKCEENYQLVTQLKEGCCLENMNIRGRVNDNYKIIKDISFSDLNKIFLLKFNYSNQSNLNIKMIRKLTEAFDKLKINPLVDVVFTRDSNSEPDERQIYSDGKINILFQGRRQKMSENSYPGDSSLPNERVDHIQLQIHRVKPNNYENVDYYSTVLALYLPFELLQALMDFVTREAK